jgi:hypothetical protein
VIASAGGETPAAHHDHDHHRHQGEDRANREVELTRDHQDADPERDYAKLRHREQNDPRIGAARELGRIEGETGHHDE